MKKNILVVANRGQNNRVLLDWYENAGEFVATIANSDERAIELVHQRPFDLVIADVTDMEIDIKKLMAILPILNEDLQLISYTGETRETLEEKVKAVFDRKKAQRLQQMLILDADISHSWDNLPSFSPN